MSHFVTFVIGDDVEGMLAPYNEQDEEYMEFVDETEKLTEEYNTKKIDAILMEDGSYVSPYDNKFQIVDGNTYKYVYPETSKKLKVSIDKLYPTLESYAYDYHGYNKREDGRFGYNSNPDAKWDWYALGGRWDGFIKTKNDGHVNECTLADIDFDGMYQEAKEKAIERYNKVVKVLGHVPTKLEYSWKDILEKYKDDIEKGREFYHKQPELIEFKAKLQAIKSSNEELYSEVIWEDYEDFTIPLEEFADNTAKYAGVPFAIVYNGEWYERGEMGWWGCVSNEKAKSEWIDEIHKLLKNLPGDTLITVVDCHI